VDDAQVLLHVNGHGLIGATTDHHPGRRVLRDGRQPQLLERLAGVRPRPSQNILAKAILRIWPIDHFGSLGTGPTLSR